MKKKTVTLVDIAKRCDTSNVTVSKALAGKAGVSDELREKIKSVAEELGYQVYKNTSSKKSRTVGVLIPRRFINLNGSFYWALYNNLVKWLKKKDFYCIMEILEPDDEKDMVMPRMLLDKKIDGLISLGQTEFKYAKALSQSTNSLIFLDYYHTEIECDYLITNGYDGGYRITKYLIAEGHKKIGFIGSTLATTSIFDRYMGYRKAMLESGLPAEEKFIVPDRDENGMTNLTLPQELPSAFVCNCDETAYLVIRQLKSRGLRVPEDISVVGYDNYVISEMCEPPITTVAIDPSEMAEQAVEMIERRITHPELKPLVKIIEGKVLIKQSVKSLVDS